MQIHNSFKIHLIFDTINCIISLISSNFQTYFDLTCNQLLQLLIAEDIVNCENYGVVYRDGLLKNVLVEYTRNQGVEPFIPQGSDAINEEMKRPPMEAIITLWDNKQIIIYNVHTSPIQAPYELQTF